MDEPQTGPIYKSCLYGHHLICIHGCGDLNVVIELSHFVNCIGGIYFLLFSPGDFITIRLIECWISYKRKKIIKTLNYQNTLTKTI